MVNRTVVKLINLCRTYSVHLRWWSEAFKLLNHFTHREVFDFISKLLYILSSL